jgi:photosystem II stability/assembly factor-like uncharacterized protein
MNRGIHGVFILAAFCASAQEAGITGGALVNNGQPMKPGFACSEEDLAAAGMSCSDEDPCPVYLELSGVASTGKKLALAGNLHGPSATLYSVLLTSDDSGANWKETAARIPGAALDQVQFVDLLHGWAAGETQVPLARDPFVLVTADGGVSWRRKFVGEEGGFGAVQRFWFDSIVHGGLIVDAGRTAKDGHYVLYESRTGGESWNIVSQTAQPPRLRGAPTVSDVDYRIATDSKSKAYVVEKRAGETWNRLASFLVQVASCGTPQAAPIPASAESPPYGK